MILLDTNVASEIMLRAPHPKVVAWYEAQSLETLFLSAVTAAELRTGVALLPQGKRRDALRNELERELLPRFFGRILPFDLECTPFLAEIMARARRTGRAIALADGYIAAIAVRNGLAVATRDTMPFLAAGAPVVNPWLE